MTRRVHWQTKGAGLLDGLSGDAVLNERDVTPLTAALRQLQRATGLEVVELGPLAPGRSYSVRLASLVKPAASCLLTLQPSRIATV